MALNLVYSSYGLVHTKRCGGNASEAAKSMIRKAGPSLPILLVAFLFGAVPAVAEVATGILDDKVFVGPTGKKGEEASGQDEIRFENGQFRSVDCDQWGFEKAPYTVQRDGDAIRFQAIALSPKHGKIEWEGVVKGNTLEAAYVWTKERWYWKDAHQEKWFKGNLK